MNKLNKTNEEKAELTTDEGDLYGDRILALESKMDEVIKIVFDSADTNWTVDEIKSKLDQRGISYVSKDTKSKLLSKL